MKIKIKKIIASILTFMMIFTQVPLSSMNVYAEDDEFSGETIDLSKLDGDYVINSNGTYNIKGCNIQNLNSKIIIDKGGLFDITFNILDDISIEKSNQDLIVFNQYQCNINVNENGHKISCQNFFI